MKDTDQIVDECFDSLPGNLDQNEDRAKAIIKAAIEKAIDERNAYWQRIAEAHDCDSLTDAFVQLTELRAGKQESAIPGMEC